MGVPGNANALLLRSAAAAGGYQVSRSLRFNSADSANLSRNLSSSPSSSFTFSMWVKRSALTPGATYQTLIGGYQSAGAIWIGFGDDDVLRWTDQTTTLVSSTAKFRDPSAWYHIVATRTSSARTIYVNGTQVATGDGGQAWSNGAAWTIGAVSGFYYFNGYIAECHFIDGSAKVPGDFAETDATTGQWIPKLYSGSYGTNGFKLTFSDNSAATAAALGKDTSGNSPANNWTPTNFSVTAGAGNDSLVDSVTSYGTDTGAGGEVRGNYCTLNPIDNPSAVVLTNGNLDHSFPSAAFKSVRATQMMSSGKWYYEMLHVVAGAMLGIARPSDNVSSHLGATSNAGIGLSNGVVYKDGASIGTGVNLNPGDVLGCAFDASAGKLWFSVNGTWVNSGNPAAGTNPIVSSLTDGTWMPAVTSYNTGSSYNSINFGQRSWAYQAPAGFKALVDTNLTAPVVAKPNTVMDVLTWSGSGGARSFTGLGFSPDLVWGKQRNGANANQLYDIVRGAGNNKDLASESTAAEGSAYASASVYGYLSSFDSTGFSVANGTDGTYGAGYWNLSGRTYVAWCFDAGSSTVTNTQGSITASVRANPSSGFSIVTFNSGPNNGVNQTIGHGLGVAPQLIIVKSRTGNATWTVYHASATSINQFLALDATNAVGTAANIWGAAAPTSTVFGFRSSQNQPQNTDCVAYVWAPVTNYSSFGSYTGNGSADGPFVYTGHRSRWLMVKRTDTSGYPWVIVDALRDGYNVTYKWLEPNSSSAEQSTQPVADVDFLSNGFKMRGVGNTTNQSAGTYIYAAFAESPFQYARAR